MISKIKNPHTMPRTAPGGHLLLAGTAQLVDLVRVLLPEALRFKAIPDNAMAPDAPGITGRYIRAL
jgi:hypothetical protein